MAFHVVLGVLNALTQHFHMAHFLTYFMLLFMLPTIRCVRLGLGYLRFKL